MNAGCNGDRNRGRSRSWGLGHNEKEALLLGIARSREGNVIVEEATCAHEKVRYQRNETSDARENANAHTHERQNITAEKTLHASSLPL